MTGTSPPTAAAPQRGDLLGQVVLVMGGSAGIRFETARHARAAGADVILTARDPERLRAAGRELGAAGTSAFDATDSVVQAIGRNEAFPARRAGIMDVDRLTQRTQPRRKP
jgi:NADP-dependent 3-hydroxy acid dehydrogenase YdfG